MADKALSYWTGVVGDASPDHTAETVIATITGVAGNPYASHVAVEVSATVTPGADGTGLTFQVLLNTVDGANIGAADIAFPAAAAVPQTCSFVVQGQIPVGVASIVLTLQQPGASADAVVSAVTMVAFVGS